MTQPPRPPSPGGREARRELLRASPSQHLPGNTGWAHTPPLRGSCFSACRPTTSRPPQSHTHPPPTRVLSPAAGLHTAQRLKRRHCPASVLSLAPRDSAAYSWTAPALLCVLPWADRLSPTHTREGREGEGKGRRRAEKEERRTGREEEIAATETKFSRGFRPRAPAPREFSNFP